MSEHEPTSKELIMMTISEIQKESWNAAIEAAAICAMHKTPGFTKGYNDLVAEEIRKLKK